jgi:hypothetical protein
VQAREIEELGAINGCSDSYMHVGTNLNADVDQAASLLDKVPFWLQALGAILAVQSLVIIAMASNRKQPYNTF